jgi:hypothetical protein
LGATDRVIVVMKRFAACFHDERQAHLIEYEVVTNRGIRKIIATKGLAAAKQEYDERSTSAAVRPACGCVNISKTSLLGNAGPRPTA